MIGLFCGWALSLESLVRLFKTKIDVSQIEGMDIPPSKYHVLEVYTKKGTLAVSLDEIAPCIRPSCLACEDMTAEFSDISVGSARLPGGWEEAKGWNQLLVRTSVGEDLVDLARSRGVLEFRAVPEENLSKLKRAAASKKRAAAERAGGESQAPRGEQHV